MRRVRWQSKGSTMPRQHSRPGSPERTSSSGKMAPASTARCMRRRMCCDRSCKRSRRSALCQTSLQPLPALSVECTLICCRPGAPPPLYSARRLGRRSTSPRSPTARPPFGIVGLCTRRPLRMAPRPRCRSSGPSTASRPTFAAARSRWCTASSGAISPRLGRSCRPSRRPEWKLRFCGRLSSTAASRRDGRGARWPKPSAGPIRRSCSPHLWQASTRWSKARRGSMSGRCSRPAWPKSRCSRWWASRADRRCHGARRSAHPGWVGSPALLN
mmetsp:Transcript_33281/g.87221  ORF Transcript_33281/g.87221 Transcript_33281/m.87221 type:complete len:272 (+) Transcript_33281:962-1777(+)